MHVVYVMQLKQGSELFFSLQWTEKYAEWQY